MVALLRAVRAGGGDCDERPEVLLHPIDCPKASAAAQSSETIRSQKCSRSRLVRCASRPIGVVGLRRRPRNLRRRLERRVHLRREAFAMGFKGRGVELGKGAKFCVNASVWRCPGGKRIQEGAGILNLVVDRRESMSTPGLLGGLLIECSVRSRVARHRVRSQHTLE